MTKRTWTPERDDFLRKTYGKMSATEIAKQLGHGITRSSCIGRAQRLGLGSSTYIQRQKSKKTCRKPYVEKYDMPTGIQMLQLTEITCRWPSGDPKKPDFCLCGSHVAPDSVYCSEHTLLAYAGTKRVRSPRDRFYADPVEEIPSSPVL